MSIKDIMHEMDVCERTAKSIYKDIKNEYNLKTKPTKQHLINYLGL